MNNDLYMRIKTAVDKADPANLLSTAPEDEYSSEINAIYQKAKTCRDKGILAEEIGRIFSSSFGWRFPEEICRKIAQDILQTPCERKES